MARKLGKQFTVYAIISNNKERENNFYFFIFFFYKKVSEIIDQIMGFLKIKLKINSHLMQQ